LRHLNKTFIIYKARSLLDILKTLTLDLLIEHVKNSRSWHLTVNVKNLRSWHLTVNVKNLQSWHLTVNVKNLRSWHLTVNVKNLRSWHLTVYTMPRIHRANIWLFTQCQEHLWSWHLTVYTMSTLYLSYSGIWIARTTVPIWIQDLPTDRLPLLYNLPTDQLTSAVVWSTNRPTDFQLLICRPPNWPLSYDRPTDRPTNFCLCLYYLLHLRNDWCHFTPTRYYVLLYKDAEYIFESRKLGV
jgi:hypothetical protein